MNFNDIYDKAKRRIANPGIDDTIKIAFMRDVDTIAATCVYNRNNTRKVAAVDTKALSQLASRPGVQAGAAALAGALLAGGGMALSSKKREDETDEEYNKRRNTESITAALAGGSVGAAVPMLAPPLMNALGARPNDSSPVGDVASHVGGSLTTGAALAPFVMLADEWRHGKKQVQIMDQMQKIRDAKPYGWVPTPEDIEAAHNKGKPAPRAIDADPLLQRHLKGLESRAARTGMVLGPWADAGKGTASMAWRHLTKGKLRNPALLAGGLVAYPLLSTVFKKMVDPEI